MQSRYLTFSAMQAGILTCLLLLLNVFTPHANAAPAPAADYLKLFPETAQAALAIPNLSQLLNHASTIAKRVEDIPENVDYVIQEGLNGIARELALSPVGKLEDLTGQLGVDAAAPMVLFVNFKPVVDRAAALTAERKRQAEAEAAAAAAAAAAAQQNAGQANPNQGTTPPPAPPKPKKVRVTLEECGMPSLAFILSLSDADKAAAKAKEVLSRESGSLHTKQVGGVEVSLTGDGPSDWGFAVVGSKLIVGQGDVLLGTVERTAHPAAFRYGTEAFPAEHAEEIVVAAHPAHLLPVLKQLLDTALISEEARPLVESQVTTMEGMLTGQAGQELLISTLFVDPQQIAFAMRMDMSLYNGLQQSIGTAKPLRLPRFLPDETLALVSFGFTNELKKTLAGTYLPGIASSLRQGRGTEVQNIGNQVVQMLGDEITLGVAAKPNDFPQVFLMFTMAQPEPTRNLLEVLIPTTGGEDYGNTSIKAIAAPIPVPLYIAFPSDVVLVSNNVDGMKAIIDRIANNTFTKALESFTPPLDPEVPRFAAVGINTKLISDVVLPLSSLMGGIKGDAGDVLAKVDKVVKEVRLLSEQRGTWYERRAQIMLKPAE